MGTSALVFQLHKKKTLPPSSIIKWSKMLHFSMWLPMTSLLFTAARWRAGTEQRASGSALKPGDSEALQRCFFRDA